MKETTAFHKAFIKYGGALDTLDLPEETRASHQNVLIDYREFSGPGIYFDFIRNKGFNAIATVYGGYEMIGIYHGLTLSLSGLFNAFLSDPEVFPDFESKEEAGLDLSNISLLLANFPNSLIGAFEPKSEARAILARNLAACSIMFILFHERTHIEAGHLHLLHREFGINAYEELPISPLSDNEQRLRRALEIEADNGAGFTSLKVWRAHWDLQFEDRFGLNVDYCWALAICMLFLMLDTLERKSNTKNETHPNSLTRYVSVMSACQSFIEEYGLNKLDFPLQDNAPIATSI